MLLVGSGAQVLREPLRALLYELCEAGADVNLVAHADGAPSSLMLLRCKTLRRLSPVGFVDFKEQGLPCIAQKHRVGVIRKYRNSSLCIRHVSDYVRALMLHHREKRGAEARSVFREEWSAGFAITEPGSRVAPRARLHDAVVLGGGVVEDDAILVRSVVCPKGMVPRGRRVLDQLVTLVTAVRSST